jgi:hypothetical protein
MPSGAMQPGETMSVADAASAAPAELGEMPGESGPTSAAVAGTTGTAGITGSMPAGAMTDAVGEMAGAVPAVLVAEMPAGLMETFTGMQGALGQASADATVMELSGQWRMSFWVTPKS